MVTRAAVADATRRERVPHAARATLFLAGAAAAVVALVLVHVTQGAADLSWGTVVSAVFAFDGSLAHKIVIHLRFPRAVVGVVAGVALGVAGVLLQSVTRNDLASPSTLGVNAGAYLAVVASIVFLPHAPGVTPLVAAFAGGVAAAALVTAFAGGARATPLRLVLAGVAVTLTFSAFTSALQIFFEDQTAGLFFWGNGSLIQNDWSGVRFAAPFVGVGVLGAFALARALDVLALGDDVARGLGQRVRRTRLAATSVGVFLTAVTVSVVGPIGFVGLVAPHLARLAGLRGHVVLVPAAALAGAALVVGADVLARSAHGVVDELPAGVVTAILGAPALYWLARRADRGRSGRSAESVHDATLRHGVPFLVLLALGVLLVLGALTAGVFLGSVSLSPRDVVDALTGNGTRFAERVVLHQRLPRVIVAALAGAALATSGALIQGVVRNPLAAPETLGVTAGAGVASLGLVLLVPTAPLSLVPAAAFAGAALALLVVYAGAWQRGGVTGTRLALLGLATSAFATAWTHLIVVRADVRVAEALVWLSGSTYARGWDEAAHLFPWVLALFPLAWLTGRSLDVLATGDDAARALGARVERVRAGVLALAVALAAAAVSTVGVISFVGLLAPHAARLLAGTRHRRVIPLAALTGALLVTLADVVGRVALAPKEIPAGLVTALVGAPYFLWLLSRSPERSGR